MRIIVRHDFVVSTASFKIRNCVGTDKMKTCRCISLIDVTNYLMSTM